MNREADYKQLLKGALVELESLQQQLAESHSTRAEPIAVVGMGCRFPGGANSPEAFWRLLESGRDAVVEIPRERWDVDACFDPDVDHPGTTYTRHAALLDLHEVEAFDPQFFGIGPREAAGIDPQHRKLLEVCWEALEQAAIPADRLFGSAAGLFVGSCTDDYMQLVSSPDRPEQIEAYTSLGTSRSILAGRVAHVLGLQGPAIHLDTACSSARACAAASATSLSRARSTCSFRRCGRSVCAG
jgi:acyl transferase domain-containing protein